MAMVKFGDVVVRANTKEDRYNTDRLYYVGGEHMETGEYLITKRGLIEGSTIGPMFYFGFRKGQVLLASRSPDLKKAGMATFDGICSEKTFVIESRDENVLLQTYLPFIVRSEQFWQYANDNQSGSVNHFINWSTFASYEFELPPIEEQAAIAEKGWAMVALRDAYRELILATDALVKSQFIELFGDPEVNKNNLPVSTLKDICVGKLSYGSGAAAVDYDGVTRYVRITDITDTGELSDDVKSPSVIDEKYLLNEGDVLFARSGATVGKTLLYREKYGRCIYAGFLIRLIPNTAIVIPEYVFGFTKSAYYEDFIKKTQRAVGQPNINAQEYGDLKICVPPIEQQKDFSKFLEQSDKSKFELKQAILKIEVMLRALTQNNFY